MPGDIPCLLGCGAGTHSLTRSGTGSRYQQCARCGLAFVARPPANPLLQAQYLEDSSSTTAYYRRTVAADRITFRKRLRLLARVQPERGRLLDVGCSTGTLMEVAQEMGWETEGLEPNPRAAHMARQRGLRVHRGFLTAELARLLPGDYNCLVMNDVVEHLPDPGQVLGLARSLLAPSGVLLLSTPNLESFWCRRFQLKPEEHLFLFTAHSLRLLLAREALEVCFLQKTSRRRALGQLHFSTTQVGRESVALIAVLCRLYLDGACAWVMEHLFRDELLVIARKDRRI